MDGVQDVFAGTEIVFHLADAKGEVNEAKLKELLAKHKVKFEDLERNDDYIL